MNQPGIVMILIVIATAVALLVRRIPMPYTVALMLTGIGLGATQWIDAPHLTKDLLFVVFLPGLVFEAAFHLPFAEVRRNARAITALAIPGVAAGIGLTAVILMGSGHLFGLGGEFGWPQALAFGGVVAATDPIAVVSLVRSLGAPPRLALLLEAESLLNDGTAIVFFALILAATGGAVTRAPDLVLHFLAIVGIGAAVGVALGALTSLVMRPINDPVLEITLTVIAAYGSFVLAERAGGSGVIATVAAGLICGNFGAGSAMSASSRVAVQSFWDYIAFLLNSMVFLLMGFEVRLPALTTQLPLVVAAVAAGWLSRGLVVTGVAAGLSRSSERVPGSWLLPLIWGGLRGGLSMVLALSLPTGFAGRDLVITATFGVVVLSILLQGTTMAPLLKAVGLTKQPTAA